MKKLVRVEWFDAVSVDGWTQSSEIKPELHLIETVGILIAETDDVITVALNHDTTGDSYSCFINIPKPWIQSRKSLRR